MSAATITTEGAGAKLHDLTQPLADVLRAIELAIDSDSTGTTDALLRLAARTLRDTGREVEQLVAELGVPPMGEFDDDEAPAAADD